MTTENIARVYGGSCVSISLADLLQGKQPNSQKPGDAKRKICSKLRGDNE